LTKFLATDLTWAPPAAWIDRIVAVPTGGNCRRALYSRALEPDFDSATRPFFYFINHESVYLKQIGYRGPSVGARNFGGCLMKRVCDYIAALAGCAVLALASQAHASGFAIREDSTEGLGTMFSGAASAADSASTAFDNPAGMTQLHGNQAEAGLVTVFPTIDFHGNATNAAGGPVSGNNGNNGGRAAAAPNLYGVFDVSDQLKLGLAINAPFGLVVKNSAGWYGRYLGIDAAVLSTNINPTIAYKINDQVSIGGGVSAQWFQAALSQAFNQSALGSPDALARFKGHDWGFGYNLGVLVTPLDGTQIGLSYRSKVEHKLHGDLDFLNVATPLGNVLKSGPATLDVSLPASVTLGITQAVMPRLSVSLGVQWTQWSTFKQVNIMSAATPIAAVNESFSDTWFTSIGASYQWNDAWTLRGGAGWDQSPVDNHYRTVALPDQDRYMVGLGFGYKISEAITLDGAYGHYFASHASINGSINNTDNNPFGATTLHGTYQLSLDYVSASVRYKF
jgi:long-chain fatty acid transport protein